MIYNKEETLITYGQHLRIRAICSIYGNDIPLFINSKLTKTNFAHPVHAIINDLYYEPTRIGQNCAIKLDLEIYDLLEIISYYRKNSIQIYNLILDDKEKQGFRIVPFIDPENIPNWIIRMI